MEAASALAENVTVVEPQLGFALNESGKLFIIKTEPPAIEPHKISTLRLAQGYLRQISRDIFPHERDIFRKIHL